MKILICVDVQNDFIDGPLGVDKDRAVTGRIVDYARKVDSDGGIVLLTRDTHDRNYLSTLEGKNLPVVHCVMGTDGWNPPAELLNLARSVVDKSAFGSLDLSDTVEWMLKDGDEIELCGFCTSICVISNALILKARFPNTRIRILGNLCSDIDEESHMVALKVARNCQMEIE